MQLILSHHASSRTQPWHGAVSLASKPRGPFQGPTMAPLATREMSIKALSHTNSALLRHTSQLVNQQHCIDWHDILITNGSCRTPWRILRALYIYEEHSGLVLLSSWPMVAAGSPDRFINFMWHAAHWPCNCCKCIVVILPCTTAGQCFHHYAQVP